MISATQKAQTIKTINEVLAQDKRIVFAYLFGSSLFGDPGNDYDLAVSVQSPQDIFTFSADLKIALSRATALPPDLFDIHVLTAELAQVDVFGLLFLKNVLEQGRLLKDADPGARSDFLERYGLKYRECEGLIQEVLA